MYNSNKGEGYIYIGLVKFNRFKTNSHIKHLSTNE